MPRPIPHGLSEGRKARFDKAGGRRPVGGEDYRGGIAPDGRKRESSDRPAILALERSEFDPYVQKRTMYSSTPWGPIAGVLLGFPGRPVGAELDIVSAGTADR